MISYEEALKKTKELKPSTNMCEEMDNAFIFSSKEDVGFEGGNHAPCVIIKETGEAINMASYVLEYGFGNQIRIIDV